MPDEYISREALLKSIMDDAAPLSLAMVYRHIHSAPAADVAPVVRCKECKYGDYDSKPNGAIVCLRTKDGFWRKEADFCSYGERKEER